ncbi:LOW QUALITY PROTEIN: hypothetical protein HID58_074778 [Brassica napus]|uniref:Uncharacterized protein n=1 Tax=Brassica napus TaxID=3708 RepID=A0ABQ7YHQ5_BRANA|nr:LOW QUALITY PROTEIN: hypothetical protein HID58_074778 [Brassica napus]
MSDLKNGQKSLIPCRHVVDMLQWAYVWYVVVPLIPRTWKWIIRKNHHDLVNALRADITVAQDQIEHDETLPPWWGLVGVGRKFDGEAGNVCIKGDTSAHTPDVCASHDFILHFLRLSGSMNRVEEYMGQDPRILRGRILARLRIRGMRRFNKTPKPKLRILMLDSTGLCLRLLSFCSFLPHLGIGGGAFSMFVLVPLILGHSQLCHNQCLDDLASCFHGTRRIPGMLFQNLKVYKYILLKPIGSGILSSRNPEAGWTFFKELVGCVDLRPGTLRNVMVVWTFSPPSGRLSLISRYAFWRSVFLYQNLGASSNASSSYSWEDLKTEPDVLVYPEAGMEAGVGAGASTCGPAGPCLTLEEKKIPRDRPGSSGRFQMVDSLRDDLAGFKTLVLHSIGCQDLFMGLVA